MLRYLFPLLSLFIAATSVAAPDMASQVERTKKPHKVTRSLVTLEYQLPNGLSVFLTENRRAPNVVVSHWVKAGSLHEAPGTTGIAHLFEHMMFRPLSAGAPSFFEISTKLGADFNASTRFESTYYYTAVPRKNLTKLLKAESDRFKNLVVTKELLDVERKAVWSEYSTKFDANPIIDLWFQIYQQAYKEHPFGWMIIGNREDLEKITAEDCNKFFQTYYKPNNVGLFVTGDFSPREALKEILKLYGDWRPGKEAQLPAPFAGETKELTGEGKLPASSEDILFGFRTPYMDKENAKVQSVLENVLFNNDTGLLKKRLVDEKKLVADVNEFNFDYDNGMMKALMTLLPGRKLSDVRSEVAKVAEDFKALSVDDFENYKRNSYIELGEGLQRNMTLAGFLAQVWGKYADIGLVPQFTSGPLDVTKAQAEQFLAKYYKPSNFTFLVHKGQNK